MISPAFQKLEASDSFLIKTPPNGYHLFFVICPTENGKYLCVNATTLKPSSEGACIIKPGKNAPAFITHDSDINYKDAIELDVSTVNKLIIKKESIPKEKISNSVLKKIQSGGLNSKRLKNKYKAFLKSYLKV